jgi:hypothetical protein
VSFELTDLTSVESFSIDKLDEKFLIVATDICVFEADVVIGYFE